MADPLSILGGVAASIQLAQCATSTLLGTIKLIREFRDIPNKTAAHLNDVERSSERVTYVCRHVLDAYSSAADRLEADSLRRLSAGCDGLRFAVDEAAAVLQPLVEASQPGKLVRAQRFWTALVSKTRESLIQQRLERIDKLNLELIGELNIVGLVAQANIRTTLKDTSSMIQRNQAQSFEHFTSMYESTTQISATVGALDDRISQITTTADSIHQQTSTFGSEMLTEFQLTHEKMKRMIHHQEIRMSSELRSIRDELLLALSTEARTATRSHRDFDDIEITPMTKQDQIMLQNSLAVSLMRRPTALRDASYLSTHRNQRLRLCDCRPSTEHRIARVWNFQVESLRKSEHRDNCPCHASGVFTWKYSVSASLSPFLSRLLEISVGAATGPGAWTVVPPLKIRKIVRRSESTIFSAFDKLLDTCVQRNTVESWESWDEKRTWVADYYTHADSESRENEFQISWKPCTIDHIESLTEFIRSEVGQGKFSGVEVDENGFTILFEFCNLLVLLGEHWKEFEPQLERLLRTLRQCNIDYQSKAIVDERLRHYGIASESRGSWVRGYITAAEYMIERGHTGRGSLGLKVPFYDAMVAQGAIDTFQNSVSENDYEGYYITGFGELPLALLRRHTEIAEALEYDALALAILNRSMENVKFLTAKPCFLYSTEKFHSSKRTYMELALGWPMGIEYLMKQNFNVVPAISLACRSGDEHSLRLLLGTKQAIFTQRLDPRRLALTCSPLWVFREAIASKNISVLKLAVSALRERRQRLYQIAVQVFSETDLQNQKTSRFNFLNGNAGLSFRTLEERISIPPELDCCSMPSAYYFLLDVQLSCQNSSIKSYGDIFQTLYDFGFCDVDGADDTGETPMFRHIRRSFDSHSFGAPSFSGGDIAEWFLGHGANVMNQTKGGWPNILFYLAFLSSRKLLSVAWRREDTEKAVVDLHTSTDTCECYCSSFGCLPMHILLRCHTQNTRHCVQSIGRLELLRRWIRLWEVGDDQKNHLSREMTRLELFERLGMAHTCCRLGQAVGKDSYLNAPFLIQCLSDSEAQQIRSEDWELKGQLECFMYHWDSWSLMAVDSLDVLHDIWWATVDEILPPLTPSECYSTQMVPPLDVINEASREQREKEALRRNGFEELEDFKEVINIHFLRQKLHLFSDQLE